MILTVIGTIDTKPILPNVMRYGMPAILETYDMSIATELRSNPPQLFISGHSHILKVMPDKHLNLLHINPGAAGKTGWHKERTLVRLTIEDNKFTDCEVITLGKR